MSENNLRVGLKNLVAQQLPEFVRAEYPTFVSFVEAYYEYLDKQSVNISDLRDIDKTLDDYIKYFKAELAHNYPTVSTNYETERFLLKHIKEQYLAKGSEASYKLLFRLLYGKDVYIDYPGRQMLRISDGRWTQESSLIVNVLQGNPYALIGKTVNVQTNQKIYNKAVVKNVDAVSEIKATVENVIEVDKSRNIYELFVNRNFYGEISPKDSIKYQSEFQATILPATAKIKIKDPGKNFKPGQVFQLSSGEGTPFWFKVATTNDSGGIKTLDVIRFGIDYKTDFSVTVLPSSAVSSKKRIVTNSDIGSISYSINQDGFTEATVLQSGVNYTLPPVITVTGDGAGAELVAVLGTGNNAGKVVAINIVHPGVGYTTAELEITNAVGDSTGSGFDAGFKLGDDYNYRLVENLDGFTEGGYLSAGDYWDVSEHGRGAVATAVLGTGNNAGKVVSVVVATHPTTNVPFGGSGYDLPPVVDIAIPTDINGQIISGAVKATAEATVVDGVVTGYTVINQGSGYTSAPAVRVFGQYGYANGAYVGTVQRQFFINAVDTQGSNPALLDVSLGAVMKYPGYYKTNDGFLNDSMFIQDSYYYQAFAYVLKIDEQLQKYASVVRSMLHPSGMAMFGEYSINNKIGLNVGLTALVKSLGITLYDSFSFKDGTTYVFIKDLVDSSVVEEPLSPITYTDQGGTVHTEYQRYPFLRVSKLLEDSFAVIHTEAEFSKVYGKILGADENYAGTPSPHRAGEFYTVYRTLPPPSLTPIPVSPTPLFAANEYVENVLDSQGNVIESYSHKHFVEEIDEAFINFGLLAEPQVVNVSNVAGVNTISSHIVSAGGTDYTIYTGEYRSIATTIVVPEQFNMVSMSDLSDGVQGPLLSVSLNIDKAEDILDVTTFGNEGYVVIEPYEQGGYFAEIYANGRASTW